MTKKPVSLKEKMPTEKDIGITIYLAKGVFSGQTVIRSFDFMPDGDYIGVASMNPDLWFWQPVTLVSEEYLKQLQEIEKKYLADLEQHCNQFGEDEPKADIKENI